MKSKIGFKILWTVLDFADQIPKGTPIIIEITLETSTNVTVFINSDHKPWFKMYPKPTKAKADNDNCFLLAK